jgi:hypothetical protein
MNRDEKGRFVKGNKCGNRFKRSNGNGNGKPSEDPRINGKKGGESHGKARLFKDIAVEMLSEEVELPNGKVVTLKDVLMNSLVKRARDNDKSLELLLKIGGEFPTEKHDVNVTSPQGVTITCETKQQEDILKRLQNKCKD